MPGPCPVTHIQQHGRQRQHLLILRLAFLRTLFDHQSALGTRPPMTRGYLREHVSDGVPLDQGLEKDIIYLE
jgi:hypothetical protein